MSTQSRTAWIRGLRPARPRCQPLHWLCLQPRPLRARPTDSPRPLIDSLSVSEASEVSAIIFFGHSYGYSSRDYRRDRTVCYRIVFHFSVRVSRLAFGQAINLLPDQTATTAGWADHNLRFLALSGFCRSPLSLWRTSCLSLFSSLPDDHTDANHHPQSHDYAIPDDHAEPYHHQHTLHY